MEQGAHLLWVQPAPSDASPATQPPSPSKYSKLNAEAVIADFARRLANLEGAITLMVPSDRVVSKILLTREAVLIQADRIGLLGEVTFADWHRDITGATTGVIDPSITRIRGGTIRTEQIVSFDGESYIDLDAVGANPFIKNRTAVVINADGTFAFGGASGKKLIFNGTNLALEGSAYLGSIGGSTVQEVIDLAGNAYDGLADKLNKAGGDILTGVLDVQMTSNYNAGFRAGNVTWNSSTGAITGGSGVVMTRLGLIGVASGATKFSISATTGAATFAGDITGATGTFAGALSSTSGAIGGFDIGSDYIRDTGNSFGIASTVTGANDVRVWAGATFANRATAPFRILEAGDLIGAAATFSSRLTANTLQAGVGSGNQPIFVDAGTTVCTNLDADKVDGVDVGAIGAGAATATFPGNNKPGSNTSNTWLAITKSGTTYYLPAWT